MRIFMALKREMKQEIKNLRFFFPPSLLSYSSTADAFKQ